MITLIHQNAIDALDQGVIDVLGHLAYQRDGIPTEMAQQIAVRWPTGLAASRVAVDSQMLALGGVQYLALPDDRWIARLVGPWTLKPEEPTMDGAALEHALRQFSTVRFSGGCRLGLPSPIGCGAFGGDSAVVTQILNRVFVDRSLTLFRWDRPHASSSLSSD